MLPLLIWLPFVVAQLCSNCTEVSNVTCPGGAEDFSIYTHGGGVISRAWVEEKTCTSGGVSRVKCTTGGNRDPMCETQCNREVRWRRGSLNALCGGSECCCTNITICSQTMASIDGRSVPVDVQSCSVGVVEVDDRKRSEDDSAEDQPFQAKVFPDRFISRKGNKIIIHKGSEKVNIHVSSGNWSSAVESGPVNTSATVDLPPMIGQNYGTVYVEVVGGSGVVTGKTFVIEPEAPCVWNRHCYVCWDMLGVPSCAEGRGVYFMKSAVGLSAMSGLIFFWGVIPWLVILICWIIGCLWRAMWCTGGFVSRLHKKKIVKKATDKVSVVFVGAKEWLSEESQPDDSTLEKGEKKLAFRRWSSIANGQTLVMILLLVPLAMACDETINSVTQLENCLVGSSGKTCMVNTIVEANLGSIGRSSCTNLKFNGSSDPGLSVELKWINRTDIVTPEFMFYTKEWVLSSSAITMCPGGDKCSVSGAGDTCSMVGANDVGVAGTIFDPFASNPGVSYCDRGPPNFGGCFFQSATCIFGRCVAKAIGPQCFAFRYRDFTSRYFFEMTISDANGPVTGGVFSMSGADFTIKTKWRGTDVDIKVKLNGQFAGPDSGLTRIGTGFVCGDRRLFKMVSSPVGVATKNLLGDIQSNQPISSSGISSPDHFQYDTALISSVDGVCSSSGSALSAASRAVRATESPFLESGNSFFPLWLGDSQNDHILMASVRNSPPIEVLTTISAPVIISQDINVVCPIVGNVSITGCRNCESLRPMLKFTAKSECASGMASMTVLDDSITLSTSTVILGTNEEVFEVIFTSATEDVSATIRMAGSGGSTDFSVGGKLNSSLIDLGSLNNITQNSNVTGVAAFFGEIGDSLTDTFSGVGTIIDWLWSIAVILACLSVLGLIVYAGIKLRGLYLSSRFALESGALQSLIKNQDSGAATIAGIQKQK